MVGYSDRRSSLRPADVGRPTAARQAMRLVRQASQRPRHDRCEILHRASHALRHFGKLWCRRARKRPSMAATRRAAKYEVGRLAEFHPHPPSFHPSNWHRREIGCTDEFFITLIINELRTRFWSRGFGWAFAVETDARKLRRHRLCGPVVFRTVPGVVFRNLPF
jgi:hypothetical protein